MSSLLSQPHFRRDNEASQATPSTQPIAPTPMLVDVDQIEPYDRNPRRTSNVMYEQIKASIQATGLDQVLSITQRPDTKHSDVYMIGAGGNTRLTAVKELWAQTGDERYRQIWCQLYPWESDTRTLLAHIRENDLRSDLTFIDRALALRELRSLLESVDEKRLSQRELRDQLAERGYQIGRTMIGWYDYTVDILFPLIPTLLQSGIGRTTIGRIYELQRAFNKAWAALELGDAEDAAGLFEQTLERHDVEAFNLDTLRRDLEEELAVTADCDLHRASIEFGAALYGRSDSDPGMAETRTTGGSTSEPQPTEPPSTAVSSPPASESQEGSPNGVDETRSTVSTTGTDRSPPLPASPTRSMSKTTQTRLDRSSSGTSEPSEPAEQPSSPTPPSVDTPERPRDLKSLRGRAWTLASRLAQSARLGDIIVPIPDGLGFLVGPVRVEIQSEMHPEVGRSAMCLWWHLATLCEQFARHGQACEAMPPEWRDRGIGQAMRQARDSTQAFSGWQWTEADRGLFADVPALEPNDMGPWLYRAWSDQRWQDWIALVETYRDINKQTNNDPWGAE